MTKDTNNDVSIGATLEAELSLFTGTTHYFRNWLGLIYTDGVKYLANRAAAFWLIDAIASWQGAVPALKKELQRWELVVAEDKSAVLSAWHDLYSPEIVHQTIEHTDFPLKSLTLFVSNGVLCLPSEY